MDDNHSEYLEDQRRPSVLLSRRLMLLSDVLDTRQTHEVALRQVLADRIIALASEEPLRGSKAPEDLVETPFAVNSHELDIIADLYGVKRCVLREHLETDADCDDLAQLRALTGVDPDLRPQRLHFSECLPSRQTQAEDSLAHIGELMRKGARVTLFDSITTACVPLVFTVIFVVTGLQMLATGNQDENFLLWIIVILTSFAITLVLLIVRRPKHDQLRALIHRPGEPGDGLRARAFIYGVADQLAQLLALQTLPATAFHDLLCHNILFEAETLTQLQPQRDLRKHIFAAAANSYASRRT